MATAQIRVPRSVRTRSRSSLALMAVEIFFGFGAVAGGLGLIAGRLGMSDDYLEGTVFDSYLIPGLALAILVGGSMFVAAWSLWKPGPSTLSATVAAAAMVIGWFVVQFATVGYISWMQPAFAALGLLQLGLIWVTFRSPAGSPVGGEP